MHRKPVFPLILFGTIYLLLNEYWTKSIFASEYIQNTEEWYQNTNDEDSATASMRSKYMYVCQKVGEKGPILKLLNVCCNKMTL